VTSSNLQRLDYCITLMIFSLIFVVVVEKCCNFYLFQPELFVALCTSARGSKNFKVRISAATAMAAPRSRELYGSSEIFLNVWQCLADVLQNLDTTDADYVEYKYKDNLVEQVRNLNCAAARQLFLLSISEARFFFRS
jgi:hypothetical protein